MKNLISKFLLKKQQEPTTEPKKPAKHLLDKLIVMVVFSTVAYVGLTFFNCNFLIPGSMERADALGGLKNPPPLECSQSISQGYNALLTLLTALLGLKAKMDD
jgi:hypothetical protein